MWGLSQIKKPNLYPSILSINTTKIYKITRRNNKKTRLNSLNIYTHINN